jgi:hypothetical protein
MSTKNIGHFILYSLLQNLQKSPQCRVSNYEFLNISDFQQLEFRHIRVFEMLKIKFLYLHLRSRLERLVLRTF